LRAPESGRDRVPESVRIADQRAFVTLEGADPIRADRIVLACGGLLGGGIVYDPPDFHAGTDMPPRESPAFHFSFEVTPSADGRPYLAVGGVRAAFPSSMFGPDLDQTAWPSAGKTGTLESIGVATREDGLAAAYLGVAGDVVEGRPRTALVAVESALRAADWAAS
jgi:glycerol-3-phosphate dehydrogenase subunit B